MTYLFTFFLILVNIALAVSGQLAIKAGMRQVGYITMERAFPMLWSALQNPYVFYGLFAYTLAAATWIMVLSRVDVSFAYPALSLGYVAVLIFSVVYLHEAVTPMRIFGTLLIVSGVMLIFRT